MKRERAVNRRMADLAQSEIRAMTQACACVSAKGLNMAQGLARAC
jgi:aminotransferase